jgi:6-phosphofructokinase 1
MSLQEVIVYIHDEGVPGINELKGALRSVAGYHELKLCFCNALPTDDKSPFIAIANKSVLEKCQTAIGVPASIQNDVPGTDICLGFDTACNNGCEMIRRIQNDANKAVIQIVELPGRESSQLAFSIALASQATAIFIPESKVSLEQVLERIKNLDNPAKCPTLITVEGQKPGRAFDLAEAVRKKSGFETQVSILGPALTCTEASFRDKTIAQRLGAAAIESARREQFGTYIAMRGTSVFLTPISHIAHSARLVDKDQLQLFEVLSGL